MKVNVKDQFGARGDGVTLATQALQAAIDACVCAGGGIVTVPPGVYLTGTIRMASDVTLHLEAGATLLGSRRLEDYPLGVGTFVDAVGQQRGRCLLLAHGVHNVGLTGGGAIDGQGAVFVGEGLFAERPFLVRFIGCEEVTVRDITLRNSAAWTSHYMNCRRVMIERVTIDSRVNENNDGIDIDSCRDVQISDCAIDTGDDAICLKSTLPEPCEDVLVQRCRLSSQCGAIKLGTESYGDMRRIKITDCVVDYAGMCGIKVISMDGAHLEDVEISDIEMKETTGPIFVRLGDRARVYGANGNGANRPARSAGHLRRVVMRGIRANVVVPADSKLNYFTKEVIPPHAFSGMTFTGVPGHCIEDVILEDVDIHFVGGGAAADCDRQPTEQPADYPEHYYFGVLPAYGLYLRHARRLTLRDVRFRLATPDARPPLVCDDVKGLTLERWVAEGAEQCAPVA